MGQQRCTRCPRPAPYPPTPSPHSHRQALVDDALKAAYSTSAAAGLLRTVAAAAQSANLKARLQTISCGQDSVDFSP